MQINAPVAYETIMRDNHYTTGQTDKRTPIKVIPMSRYAPQATQNEHMLLF